MDEVEREESASHGEQMGNELFLRVQKLKEFCQSQHSTTSYETQKLPWLIRNIPSSPFC